MLFSLISFTNVCLAHPRGCKPVAEVSFLLLGVVRTLVVEDRLAAVADTDWNNRRLGKYNTPVA